MRTNRESVFVPEYIFSREISIFNSASLVYRRAVNARDSQFKIVQIGKNGQFNGTCTYVFRKRIAVYQHDIFVQYVFAPLFVSFHWVYFYSWHNDISKTNYTYSVGPGENSLIKFSKADFVFLFARIKQIFYKNIFHYDALFEIIFRFAHSDGRLHE